MIDDPNIEYEDKPEVDEDGNPIWYMPTLPDMDEFTSYKFNTPVENIPNGYYESVWSTSTTSKTRATGEQLANPIDVILENTDDYKDDQGQLNTSEEKYNAAADKIVEILTNVLQKGKITGEDNAEFLAAQHELSIYGTKIKNLCDNQKIQIQSKESKNIKDSYQLTTVDKIIDLLTDGGTKPWLYKDENNNVLIDGTSVPELSVIARKLNLIATDGKDSSSISLNPQFIEMISKNITLTADRIELNGYVSTDVLSVNHIDNPCYPATLPGSVDLYVNNNVGNDDYTLDDILQSYDEAEEKSNNTLRKKFKTLQGALDASPAYLNNKNLRITLETDTTENIYIRGFTSGAVRIYFAGKAIYGYVHGYANSATVNMYGGTIDNPTASQGIIHPNTGFNLGTRCVSAGFESCQYVALYKIKVFGADNKPSSVSSDYKVAVASSAGTGSIYCSDVEVTNCAIGFRTNNMGCLHAAQTSGVASRYGFESVTGGQISLADTSQAGGTTENTHESSGGQVWYKSPTFSTDNESSESVVAPSTSTTKTITIKSTYGDTYRSTVYNNWKKDGICIQGDYGYGDCTGLWFFGTAFSELKGYTINKVEITITRNRGGSSSPVGLVVRTHNYSARPSAAPKLSSSSYGTLPLATGTTGTLIITNSDVLNGIKNGTVKGFGIRTTYNAAHYAVCSGNATVKITYNE